MFVFVCVCVGRLLRLPGLSLTQLRPYPGPRGRLGGYPQCVYDARLAHGHFRFRHLALDDDDDGAGAEDGYGGLCCG